MNNKPKAIGNVILCNDIIKDITHKLSFIGCYTGDIVVPDFPASLKFALYVEVFAVGSSVVELFIKIGDEEMGTIKAQLQGGKKDVAAPLIIPGMEIGIESAEDFTIEAQLDGGKRFALLRKHIQQGEVAQLIATAPSP